MEKLTILGINIKIFTIILLVLFVLLIALVIFLIHKMNIMAIKYNDLVSGKKGADLEKIIRIRFKEMDKVKANAKRVTREHKLLQRHFLRSISKYSLVKYDAFEENAGKLSFVIALLNDDNSGILINSMYTRQGCYTFAKEVINGESFTPLSKEEKEALAQAKTIEEELDALNAATEAEAEFFNPDISVEEYNKMIQEYYQNPEYAENNQENYIPNQEYAAANSEYYDSNSEYVDPNGNPYQQ